MAGKGRNEGEEKKEGQREGRKDCRAAVHVSFAIVAVLAIISVLVALTRGGASFSGLAIDAAMVTLFWWLAARSRPSAGAIVTSQIVILLSVAATVFGFWGWSLAGVTFDTYEHLLAAFAATLLLAAYLEERLHDRKRAILYAAGVVFLLGLGVEVAEFVDGLLKGSLQGDLPATCFRSFCNYWQDTAKDLLDDALGAAFVVVALFERRR